MLSYSYENFKIFNKQCYILHRLKEEEEKVSSSTEFSKNKDYKENRIKKILYIISNKF